MSPNRGYPPRSSNAIIIMTIIITIIIKTFVVVVVVVVVLYLSDLAGGTPYLTPPKPAYPMSKIAFPTASLLTEYV